MSPRAPAGGSSASERFAAKVNQVKPRHPRQPHRRMVDGTWATGNTAALKHGRRAKVSLQKRREEILAGWRAVWRDQDGKLPPDVDALLMELAGAQALADLAQRYLERSRVGPTTKRFEKAFRARMDALDRIGRLVALLDNLEAVPPGAATGGGPTVVRFGGRYRAGELRPLVIDRVSSRAEMLEALGQTDEDEPQPALYVTPAAPPVIDVEPVVASPPPPPMRERGKVVQWNGRTGGLLPASGSGVLLLSHVHVARPDALVMGARVTFTRADGHAVDVQVEG